MCGGSGCGQTIPSDWRWVDKNSHGCGGGC